MVSGFPGGLVVRISGSQCCVPVSVPSRGPEILQAVWCGLPTHSSPKNKRKKIKEIRWQVHKWLAGTGVGGTYLTYVWSRKASWIWLPGWPCKGRFGGEGAMLPRSKGPQSCVFLRNRGGLCAARDTQQVGEGCGVRQTRHAESDLMAGLERTLHWFLWVQWEPIEGICRGVVCLILYLFLSSCYLLGGKRVWFHVFYVCESVSVW